MRAKPIPINPKHFDVMCRAQAVRNGKPQFSVDGKMRVQTSTGERANQMAKANMKQRCAEKGLKGVNRILVLSVKEVDPSSEFGPTKALGSTPVPVAGKATGAKLLNHTPRRIAGSAIKRTGIALVKLALRIWPYGGTIGGSRLTTPE